jgi:hypothetical protein
MELRENENDSLNRPIPIFNVGTVSNVFYWTNHFKNPRQSPNSSASLRLRARQFLKKERIFAQRRNGAERKKENKKRRTHGIADKKNSAISRFSACSALKKEFPKAGWKFAPTKQSQPTRLRFH